MLHRMVESGRRWLHDLLQHLMETKETGLIDTGSGDTATTRLFHAAPGLVDTLETAGVHPVAMHFLSPRETELATLDVMEKAGFQLKATALLLNEGCVDSSMDTVDAFATVRRHSMFRRAVDRGAVPVWIPRLSRDVMAEIEAKQLSFAQARDRTVLGGARFTPIGPFDSLLVARWLREMEEWFAPIRSWLP
jgi:hypothetical protein